MNFNGGSKVLRCLQALTEQSVPPDEVVVVDNGSTDGSLQEIEATFPDCRTVSMGANSGLPKARNRGIQELSSDLVLSIDSDIYLEPTCLELLVRAHLKSGAVMVCPRILLLPGANTVQCDGASVHFLGSLALRHASLPAEDTPIEAEEVGGCIGACLLFERRSALESGAFDELFFFYHEDLEFSLKLRARGYRLFCEPKAQVLHDLGSGYQGLSFRGQGSYPKRRVYLSFRHRWLVVLIHYRFRTLVLLAPALLTFEIATLVLSILRGWMRPWGTALWWILSHPSQIHSRRTREQAAKKIRDRDLLTGGPIPLAPGFTRSKIFQALINAMSRLLNAYWITIRKLVG